MKSFICFISLFSSLSLMAWGPQGGGTDCSQVAKSNLKARGLDNFTCTIKDLKNGGKKLNFTFPGIVATEETDLLCVTNFYDVVINNIKVELTGALMTDNECKNGKRCRIAIGMKVNGGDTQIAYANDATKIGLVDDEVKVSCSVK